MNALTQRGSLFDELFKDLAPGFYVRPLHGDALPSPAQIKLDVKESPEAYTVMAELPGVPREDIQVTIDGGLVTISAEVKQQDAQTEGERVLRSERYFGQVARRFSLPVEIDQAQAKARYDHGVLTLTLPKQVAAGAHRLTID
jgi:HSP20 family protein